MSPDKRTRRRILQLLVAVTVASAGGCARSAYRLLATETKSCPFDADLTRFRAEVLERDKSFTGEQRMRAFDLFEKLEQNCQAQTQASLHLEIARILALSKNAHTGLLNTKWQWLFSRLPLRFIFFGDRLFVGYAESEWLAIQDREVLAINGMNIRDFEDVWATFQSGRNGWRRQFLYHFLECPPMLAAAGIGSDPNNVTLTVRGLYKGHENHTIRGSAYQADVEGIEAVIPPPRVELLHRLRDLERPLYLGDPDAPFRFLKLKGSEIPYLHFRSNIDFTGRRDISRFADTVSKQLEAQAPMALVVDQRHNWGGDLTTTRDLMKKLPSFVSGKIVVLTSGRTFSAGIASTAYLKQAGGGRVRIVGEPVGDDLDFWAEGDLVTFEDLRADVLYALERHDYQFGCPGEECHAHIRQDPIQIDDLEPDIPLSVSQADFLAGHDPILEAAVSLCA